MTRCALLAALFYGEVLFLEESALAVSEVVAYQLAAFHAIRGEAVAIFGEPERKWKSRFFRVYCGMVSVFTGLHVRGALSESEGVAE